MENTRNRQGQGEKAASLEDNQETMTHLKPNEEMCNKE
jgi:hypothetical protein